MSLTQTGPVVIGQLVMCWTDALKHCWDVGGIWWRHTEMRALTIVCRTLIPTYTPRHDSVHRRATASQQLKHVNFSSVHTCLHPSVLKISQLPCYPIYWYVQCTAIITTTTKVIFYLASVCLTISLLATSCKITYRIFKQWLNFVGHWHLDPNPGNFRRILARQGKFTQSDLYLCIKWSNLHENLSPHRYLWARKSLLNFGSLSASGVRNQDLPVLSGYDRIIITTARYIPEGL